MIKFKQLFFLLIVTSMSIIVTIIVHASQVNVTLNPNGGSVNPTSKSVTVDSTYGTLPTPTKTGQNFKGWKLKDYHQVQFKLADNTLLATRLVKNNTAIIFPTEIIESSAPSGQTTEGYYTNTALTTKFTESTLITAPRTLYVKYITVAPKEILIGGLEYLDILDKIEIESSVINIKDSLSDLAVGAPDWIFVGWFLDSNCLQPITSETKVSDVDIIYPGWTPNTASWTTSLTTVSGHQYISGYLGSQTSIRIFSYDALNRRPIMIKPAPSSTRSIFNKAGYDWDKHIKEVRFSKKLKASDNNFNYVCAEMTSLEVAPIMPETTTSMDGAFKGCTSLVNAPIIPDNITSIASTFLGCTSLKNVPNFPPSLTNMSSAFSRCSSLVSIPELPDTVISMVEAFMLCSSLEIAPQIPPLVKSVESITTFKYGLFYECTSLKIAPDMSKNTVLKNIDYMFNGCTALTTVPALPPNVISMRETFIRCTNLVDVPDIPESVNILQGTFVDCTSLVIAPRINSTHIEVMMDAFENCTSLTTITDMPFSVRYMRDAFRGCTKLTGTITIRHKVQYSQPINSPNDYSDAFRDAGKDTVNGIILNWKSPATESCVNFLVGTKGSYGKVTKGVQVY